MLLTFEGVSYQTFENSGETGFPCYSTPILNEARLSDTLHSIENQHGALRGLFYVHPQLSPAANLEDLSQKLLYQVFLLAKQLKPRLHNESDGSRNHFMTIVRIDGKLGYENPGTDCSTGGLPGLVKTLQKEWPGVFCRFLDIGPNRPVEESVEKVMAELNDPDMRLSEVGRYRDDRCTVIGSKWKPEKGSQHQVQISKEDVFLVSGGARGVTAECIISLAEKVPARFILAGRTPVQDEPEWARGCEDENSLRQAAIQTFSSSGEKPTPQKIRKTISNIQANRSITRTITRLKETGAETEYVSVDVTNAVDLKQAIQPFTQKWGPVTGIIHGAGVLRDKQIENKTLEDIERVYVTKVHGLRALLACVAPERLKQLVLFSSAAGFYGNSGQSDYASANEVLNKHALYFNKKHPQCHVMSFNWGPWEGGMVTQELKKMFLERGVEVIPIQEGTRIFVETLLGPVLENPLVLVGSAMGSPPTTRGKQQMHRRIDRNLKLNAVPVLKDHRIGEHAVLPAVFALSWMVESVLPFYPGYRLQQCKQFKVLKGIVFDPSMPITYLLDLMETGNDAEDNICVTTKISSAHEKRPRFHYSCEITLSSVKIQPPNMGRIEISDKTGITGKTLYRDGTLFHGPGFQGVKYLLNLDEGGLTLQCQTPQSDSAEEGPFTSGTMNLYAFDLAFQAMLVWARKFQHSASLPLSTGKLEHFTSVPSDVPFYITLRVQEQTASMMKADIFLHDEHGAVYSRFVDAQVTLSQQLNSVFAKSA